MPKGPYAVASLLLGICELAQGATFTVNSNADAGVGTFRWAIEQANATPGRDSINVSQVLVIAPASPLPAITESVEINTSAPQQPYGVGMTLDGTNAGAAANGLVIRTSAVSINHQAVWDYKHLRITHFDGDGIVVEGDDNEVLGIELASCGNGIRLSGSRNSVGSVKASGHANNGLLLTATASHNEIGFGDGIIVEGSSYYPVTAVGNGAAGIRVDGPDNKLDLISAASNGIGLLFEGDRNTTGLIIDVQSNGTGIVVHGNYNLLETWGDPVKSNAGDGIVVSGVGNELPGWVSSNNGGYGFVFQQPVDVSYLGLMGVCNGKELIAKTTDIAPPTISATRGPTGMTLITGTMTGPPGSRYRIFPLTFPETPCPERNANFVYPIVVYPAVVTLDGNGSASFQAITQTFSGTVAAFAARLLSNGEPGGTSVLSGEVNVEYDPEPRADISIRMTAPVSGVPGQTITVTYEITNHGPAVSGQTFFTPSDAAGARVADNVTCSYRCGGQWIAPGQTIIVERKLRITGAPGTMLRESATLDFADWQSLYDPVSANNSAELQIAVAAGAPMLSPAVIVLLIVSVAAIAVGRLRA